MLPRLAASFTDRPCFGCGIDVVDVAVAVAVAVAVVVAVDARPRRHVRQVAGVADQRTGHVVEQMSCDDGRRSARRIRRRHVVVQFEGGRVGAFRLEGVAVVRVLVGLRRRLQVVESVVRRPRHRRFFVKVGHRRVALHAVDRLGQALQRPVLETVEDGGRFRLLGHVRLVVERRVAVAVRRRGAPARLPQNALERDAAALGQRVAAARVGAVAVQRRLRNLTQTEALADAAHRQRAGAARRRRGLFVGHSVVLVDFAFGRRRRLLRPDQNDSTRTLRRVTAAPASSHERQRFFSLFSFTLPRIENSFNSPRLSVASHSCLI